MTITFNKMDRYDFPVKERPLFFDRVRFDDNDDNPDLIEVASHKAIVHAETNKVLGVVSNKYKMFEHKDVIEKALPFIESFGEAKGNVHVEKDGARMVASFIFAKQVFEVKNRGVGDVVNFGMKLVSTYDGSGSVAMKIWAEVLRCTNGMVSPNGVFQAFIRHVGKDKELIFPEMEMAAAAFEKSKTFWQRMADQSISMNSVLLENVEAMNKAYQVLPEKAMEHHEVANQLASSKNYWDLYNAFTWGITHVTTDRTTEALKIEKSRRLNTMIVELMRGKRADSEPITVTPVLA